MLESGVHDGRCVFVGMIHCLLKHEPMSMSVLVGLEAVFMLEKYLDIWACSWWRYISCICVVCYYVRKGGCDAWEMCWCM